MKIDLAEYYENYFEDYTVEEIPNSTDVRISYNGEYMFDFYRNPDTAWQELRDEEEIEDVGREFRTSLKAWARDKYLAELLNSGDIANHEWKAGVIDGIFQFYVDGIFVCKADETIERKIAQQGKIDAVVIDAVIEKIKKIYK